MLRIGPVILKAEEIAKRVERDLPVWGQATEGYEPRPMAADVYAFACLTFEVLTGEVHAGFAILAKWAERSPAGCFVFTSNVDGQFQRVGFDDDRIAECHGSIHHLQCASPCHQGLWSADDVDVPVDLETFEASEPLPRCASCGDIARPNVLMFGDWGWVGHRTSAQETRLMRWLAEHAGPGVVVVEMGAGTAIPTVRMTSEQAARKGGTLIRINPREPQVPSGQIGIAGPAMATLQAIDARMWGPSS